MAIKEALLSEFDHEVGTTRKLLELVPDGQLGWKPHDKSMSLGRLATHLAGITGWTGTILSETSFDLAAAPRGLEPGTSRADILTLFEATVRRARAAMDRSDAEYLAMWSLRRGGQEVFSLPRAAAFRSFVMSHLIHHRGQLSVYLRLLGIPVPSIYGPSADEGWKEVLGSADLAADGRPRATTVD
jgi:uncharacterized damage-inducible protein DinB